MAIFPQTSVVQFPPIALPGQIADAVRHLVKGGKLDVDSDAGLFVCRGATGPTAGPIESETIKLPEADTDVTGAAARGFLVYRPMHQIPTGQATQWIATDWANYLQQGQIWVQSAEQMAVDDPVYVIFDPTDQGKVQNDDGGMTPTAALLPSSRVVAVASATLCLVEINIP